MNKQELESLDLIIDEISFLIKESKDQIYIQTNSILTMLFWQIGNKINYEILKNDRAEYGKQIVVTLSRQLVNRFGRNFEEKNLRRMLQFAEQFTNKENVVTLSRQLSWSHFLAILPLKQAEAKKYYTNLVSMQNLSVRDLRKQIQQKSFERALISNSQIKQQNNFPLNTFKDPYLLDFLNLENDFLEKDLEQAILKELETFIIELGKGFTFVERQKRMIIDGDDYYLDLLFYHRKLKRLIAIELKLGKFQAKYKGQMELYLKWLDKYEKQEHEEKPIGLILCSENSREQVELLEMSKDGIIVSEYWTDLLPKKVFQDKIHQLLLETKERIQLRKLE